MSIGRSFFGFYSRRRYLVDSMAMFYPSALSCHNKTDSDYSPAHSHVGDVLVVRAGVVCEILELRKS